MSRAERQQESFSESDHVIYVLPPWAQKSQDRSFEPEPTRSAWRSFLQTAMLQLKVMLLIGVLGVGGAFGLKALYVAKSNAGVDTVPGIHGPDVVPFLRD